MRLLKRGYGLKMGTPSLKKNLNHPIIQLFIIAWFFLQLLQGTIYICTSVFHFFSWHIACMGQVNLDLFFEMAKYL